SAVMVLIPHGPSVVVVVVWMMMLTTRVDVVEGGRMKGRRLRSKPYDRPRSEWAEDALKLADLTAEFSNFGLLRLPQTGLGEVITELSDVHLEDTCSSTWKDDRTSGSVMTATLWARRGAPNEPYHLDCISFHQRLRDTTPLSNLTDPFKKLINTSAIPGFTDVQYMSKYYVNLKYFMPTQLEGDGLTCHQQLDRRIHEGLGGYLLAFNTAHEISSNAATQEYWSFDQDEVVRGVELEWFRDTGKYMIVSLTIISPYNMPIPEDYPIHYSNLESMNVDASASAATNESFSAYIAYSEAASALLEGDTPSFTLTPPLFEAALA
ncbi:hypothetical protein FOZ62_029308, partial [Perkinsus olseni]